MESLRFALVALVASIVFAGGLGAQEIESTRGVALVVGNGTYTNVKPLANPGNDAADMAKALKDLGWDVVLAKDTSLAAFRAAVRDFGKKLPGAKAGFFFYAGHGLQVDGTNYLVPVDADIQDKAEVPDVTVSADLVLRTMDDSHVPLKILVLDACRDNPFEKVRSIGGSRGLSVVQTQVTGTIMVFATAPNDVSEDGTGRNGVFTGAFLKNIRTPGVEFQEIFDLTAQEVTAKTGGKQNPWMNKSFYNKLYFISPAEAQATADKSLALLKAEQDLLAKQMADRAQVIAGTLDSTEKIKLELEQKKARAQADAQQQEQSALERSRQEASQRAAEEAKNRDLAVRRTREADDQLAVLRQQVEAQRQAARESGVLPDDPAETVLRLKVLDEGLGAIKARFDDGLAKGVAAANDAWQARKAAVDRYQMDPWENQKDLDRRKAQASALATRDRDNEIGRLKYTFGQSADAEGADLAKERDDLNQALVTKSWTLAPGTLTVTRGDFNRDTKSWTLTVTSVKPPVSQDIEYKLDFKNSADLKAGYTAFDTGWKAGAYGVQGFYQVHKAGFGEYWQSTLVRLAVIDITKENAPLVTLNLNQPLGWVGPAPQPALVTVTVPRAATVWAGARKLADLKPQLFNADALTYLWSTDAYGPQTLQARYADGDLENLPVDPEPGLKVQAAFLVKAKPLSLMVTVPGGTFLMGSPPREQGRKRDEQTHPVTVDQFAIGSTDVTQAQWEKVMGTNPSQFKGDDLPVVDVTWYDAVNYCNRLSVLEGRTPAYSVNGTEVTWNRAADGYRLPTEAEWEWAARGGAQNNGNLFAGSSWLDDVSWNRDNSGKSVHPVGRKKPNGLGLYDMSGNVWQWCWDWYGNYPLGALVNPVGPVQGPTKVIRGGNWAAGEPMARVSNRSFGNPGLRGSTLGFRVVCPVLG